MHQQKNANKYFTKAKIKHLVIVLACVSRQIAIVVSESKRNEKRGARERRVGRVVRAVRVVTVVRDAAASARRQTIQRSMGPVTLQVANVIRRSEADARAKSNLQNKDHAIDPEGGDSTPATLSAGNASYGSGNTKTNFAAPFQQFVNGLNERKTCVAEGSTHHLSVEHVQDDVQKNKTRQSKSFHVMRNGSGVLSRLPLWRQQHRACSKIIIELTTLHKPNRSKDLEKSHLECTRTTVTSTGKARGALISHFTRSV